MILVNEKVEHISYGFGVVSEEGENKISVKFQEDIGSKTRKEIMTKCLKLVI